jgi:hypothetical protein
VITKADSKTHNVGVEIALGLEGNVFVTTFRVPIGEAVAKCAVPTTPHEESRAELIAITKIVVIRIALVYETTTRFVVFVLGIIEWMYVAQAVGSATDEKANVNTTEIHNLADAKRDNPASPAQMTKTRSPRKHKSPTLQKMQ